MGFIMRTYKRVLGMPDMLARRSSVAADRTAGELASDRFRTTAVSKRL